MRCVLVCSIFLTIVSGCTLEVAREAGKAIKSIDTTIKNNRTDKVEIDKNERKKINKIQNNFNISLIGKEKDQVFSLLGKPNLIRTDGKTVSIRFNKENCIAYTYFNTEASKKRVEYFELRNREGKLIKNPSAIKKCLYNFSES